MKNRLSDKDGFARGPYRLNIGASVASPYGIGVIIDGASEWEDGRCFTRYDIELADGSIIREILEPALGPLKAAPGLA